MAVGAMIDNEGGPFDLNKKMKDLIKEGASLERQGIIREFAPSLMQDLYGQVIFYWCIREKQDEWWSCEEANHECPGR